MDRLQSNVERVRVRRCQGSPDNAKQTLEARHSHVQQVQSFLFYKLLIRV